MIKRLLLLALPALMINVVHAGAYTNKPYGASQKATIVFSDENAEALMPSKPAARAAVKTEEEHGSWMTSLGTYDDEFHEDLEKLIRSKKPNRAYASISDSSGKAVHYTGAVSHLGNGYSGGARLSNNINRNSYDMIIESIADRYGVARGLVKAVMHTESSFNRFARSPVGAQGLMQLMPSTARRFNVSDSYDPKQNIEGGVRYLSLLMRRYNGNLHLVLAAYNAGEGNVEKYGGIPPFKETQDYVRRVMERYNVLYKQI